MHFNFPTQGVRNDFRNFFRTMAPYVVIPFRRKCKLKYTIVLIVIVVVAKLVHTGSGNKTDENETVFREMENQEDHEEHRQKDSEDKFHDYDDSKIAQDLAPRPFIQSDAKKEEKLKAVVKELEKEIPHEKIEKVSKNDATKTAATHGNADKDKKEDIPNDMDATTPSPSNKPPLIPNIFHFIWIGENRQMTFMNYISILSAYKIQKPVAMNIHHDYLPVGYWWDRVKHDVPLLKTRFTKSPKLTPGGHAIKSIMDQVHLLKLQILIKHGGIYMDNDVIVVRKLEPLRRYNVTFGECKTHTKISSAFIMAAHKAVFIQMWYNTYLTDYKPLVLGYNSDVVPHNMMKQHPGLAHMDKWRFTTPGVNEHARLVHGTIYWRHLFVIHLMTRRFKYGHMTFESAKTDNSTLGEVVRYIYYDSTEFVNK